MKLEFLGAAKVVTGSKTILHVNEQKYLVDCGLYQGPRLLRQLNWDLDFNPLEINAVFLTHAHIDHSGLLPRLYLKGYRGPIYCSLGTFELCEILLLDAAKIQEEDAEYANRTKYSNHNPAEPLYTINDATEVLKQFVVAGVDQWVPCNNIHFRLIHSGHILGSTFVQIKTQDPDKIITFSGDLGHDHSSILQGPKKIEESHFLILESTYGDHLRSRTSPKEQLSLFLNCILKRKGAAIIPAFTVGRAQEILYTISLLMNENLIPKVPVYLDSPMALAATELFLKHSEVHKENAKIIGSNFIQVNSRLDSEALVTKEGPFIVITASGMLTGGRVMHHLKGRLPDKKNGVIIVGYQAEETKGRLLVDGIKSLRIHHQEISVNADIFHMDGFSAHADYLEIIDWLKGFKKAPQCIFLNHGSMKSASSLKTFIQSEFAYKATIPERGEVLDLQAWDFSNV